jgi:hypothetical protein
MPKTAKESAEQKLAQMRASREAALMEADDEREALAEAESRLNTEGVNLELEAAPSNDGEWSLGGAIKGLNTVTVYHRASREPRVINENMLGVVLRKVDPATGKLAFQMREPEEAPFMGQHPCMLHASNPNRAHYDEMGLPECKAGHLRNAYEVDRHMSVKHKSALAAIRREELAGQQEEERAFRRALLAR